MTVHRMTTSITVGREAEDAYRLWSDLGRLAQVMPHVRSITPIDETRSHWIVDGPLGMSVEWDAELTRSDPNKRIAWTSAHDGGLRTSGQVTFNPLPKGQTQITVVLQYAASLLQDAIARDWTRRALDEDLKSFKAHAEGRTAA